MKVVGLSGLFLYKGFLNYLLRRPLADVRVIILFLSRIPYLLVDRIDIACECQVNQPTNQLQSR